MSSERRQMSRSRILKGANDILDAGMFSDLTVDALARTLRMSKSTLYKYFARKDDVIVALIDAACAQTDRDLDMLDLHGGTAREVLDKLVEIHARHAQRIPRAAVLQQSRLPNQCQDRIEVTSARLAAATGDVIGRGFEQGLFPYEQPALATSSFMAASKAAMKTAARGDDTHSSRGEAVKAVYHLLLPGMQTAPGTEV